MLPCRCPLLTESPFARLRRYRPRPVIFGSGQRELPHLHRSYWLMRRTIILLPTSVIPISTGLRRLLRAPAGRWPFPTLSLRSLYRCLGPCPATIERCTRPFLPAQRRPLLRVKKIGSWKIPTTQLYVGEVIEAATIPLCSGSHTRLAHRLF